MSGALPLPELAHCALEGGTHATDRETGLLTVMGAQPSEKPHEGGWRVHQTHIAITLLHVTPAPGGGAPVYPHLLTPPA